MPIRFNKDSIKDDFDNVIEGFSFNVGGLKKLIIII